jgi:hypothetical protein
MKNLYSPINILIYPIITILSITIFISCNKKDTIPNNRRVIDAYYGIDFYDQYYFDTGSIWVYQDFISKRIDTVKCVSAWSKDHYVASEYYRFLVRHGQVDFFSTDQKKIFSFYFDFPESSRIMVHYYHDLYYVDGINSVKFFTDYSWGMGRNPDSIYLNNGKGFYTNRGSFILNENIIQLYLAGKIGVVRKKVYRLADHQLTEDWEILSFKVKPKY